MPQEPIAGGHRLAASSSVYLRLHAHQPVDWWPWCDEAFEEARRRDVPVLLSVGYATCHWCHVMARESFDDRTVAERINAGFVAVKVDREARPDVDAVYMSALQALTGSGGWPMTLALTHDRAPWFAGTYFPPSERHGQPSFARVLTALDAAWRDRRPEVLRSAGEIAAALEAGAGASAPPQAARIQRSEADADPSTRLARVEPRVLAALEAAFDERHGGFSGAPKFPPHAALRWLEAQPGPAAADMRARTLRAIADGGVTDQLGGALHRYAVDEAWGVPHFEVMLVDQAQMLPRYARAAREFGDPRLVWAATAMLDALERELVRDDGLFATGLDAEAEGVEGAFHTWTPSELADALSDPREAAAAASLFGVGPAGPLDGRSVLAWRGGDAEAEAPRLRARLLERRSARPAPRRDEPAITAYVGMAVRGLADAAADLPTADAARALRLATRAADAVWSRAWDGRRLRRSVDTRTDEGDHGVALLDDQVHPALGALALHRAGAGRRHLERALQLASAVAEGFALAGGGFATVPLDVPAPLVRVRDAWDGAQPAAEGAAVELLARAWAWTEREDWRRAAEATLARVEERVASSPTAFVSLLLAARVLRAPPLQVVVVGPSDDPRTLELLAAARSASASACVVRSDGPEDPLVAWLPWLEGRGSAGGPTAYACRAGVCRLPVRSVEALLDEIAALVPGDLGGGGEDDGAAATVRDPRLG